MINEIFSQMVASFKPGVLEKALSFYFSINEQKKTVFLGPHSCRVEDGKSIENADCVCKTSPDFFIRIWEQDYRPGLKDFLCGDIRSNNPEALKAFLSAFGKSA
jgi:putative sterol carrier protein